MMFLNFFLRSYNVWLKFEKELEIFFLSFDKKNSFAYIFFSKVDMHSSGFNNLGTSSHGNGYGAWDPRRSRYDDRRSRGWRRNGSPRSMRTQRSRRDRRRMMKMM